MDNGYPPEAWQRLGERLRARRGELGYGFRQRRQFLEDRGGPPPSYKMLDRIERGERPGYPDETLAIIEGLYEWGPGSIDAVLRGDEPVPVAGARQPESRGPRPQLAAVPDLDDDAAMELLIERSGDDREVLAAMWRAYTAGKQPRDVVLRKMVAFMAADAAVPPASERGNDGNARNA